MTDPAAHTPPDPAGAPDVDTLVETIRLAIWGYANPPYHEARQRALDALSDLAATAREGFNQGWTSGRADIEAADGRAEAAEADRDRLARRVAELEAALRSARDTGFARAHDPHGDLARKAEAIINSALAGDEGAK